MEYINNVFSSLLKEKEMIQNQIREIEKINKKSDNKNYLKDKENLEMQLQKVCMSIWMVVITDTADSDKQ